MVDTPAEYVAALLKGPLDLAWNEVGGEWEHYLHRALIERFGEASMYNQWFGPPEQGTVYYEFRITSPATESFLRLIPGAKGTEALVVGPSLDVVESGRGIWLDAVTAATTSVGSAHPEFPWFALVTSEPVLSAPPQVLRREQEVGGMHVKPSGVAFWEHEPHAASLDGYRVRCSSPVIVKGVDKGYDFEPAQLKATRRVAQLRSLLSVVLGERWVIKLSPIDHEVPVPGSPWGRGPKDPPQTLTGRAHVEVDLPGWASEAWDRTEREPAVARAVAIYQEALDVWDEHPSIALVCLVGALEGIGSRYHDLVRCDCCPACMITTGSSKRFRAALSTVMEKDEASALIAAYAPRSKTVHEGRLFGSEYTAGISGGGLTEADPLSEFELVLVDDLRTAAREVLLLALRGQLPTEPAW